MKGKRKIFNPGHNTKYFTIIPPRKEIKEIETEE